MRDTVAKLFQFAYLGFGALFIFKAYNIWNVDRSRAYLMLFLSATAIFLFFFRRHFNNKFKNRKQQ